MNTRFLLLALAAMLNLHSSAQTNPQRGYIIMNDGKIITGMIDYRSDTKNAQSCLFKADGSTEYCTYLPTDIKGYRLENFDDNKTSGGVYYVTRTFPVEGKGQTFFAEFLLKGGISLYRHVEKSEEYFYFVDSNGKVATMKTLSESYSDSRQLTEAKRRSMMEATQMFAHSATAMKSLWNSGYNPERLTRLTREYNEKYCTEEECILYQYDANKSAYIDAHFRIEAGIALGFFKAECYRDLSNIEPLEKTCVVPQIGVGADMLLPRLSRNLYVQALLLVGYWTLSKDEEVKGWGTRKNSLKFFNGELDLGLAYNFSPEKRISPLLRGGIMMWQPLGKKAEGFEAYYVGAGNGLIDPPKINAKVGFYVGVGCDFKVNKHRVSTALNFQYRKNNPSLLNTSALSLSVGYVL
jgi:hypothetical protein